jgi:hypothetical protein
MIGPSHTVLIYKLKDFARPHRKSQKVDWFSSPREASQKVNILSGGHQGLPL